MEAAKAEAAFLEYVQYRVPWDMKARLCSPLSQSELKQEVDDMRRSRAPGPDGVVLKFYKLFKYLIDTDFLKMITESVAKGRLPAQVTHGMIAFLYKGGARQALTNWRPISMLNMGYKIYAKALQLRL